MMSLTEAEAGAWTQCCLFKARSEPQFCFLFELSLAGSCISSCELREISKEK